MKIEDIIEKIEELEGIESVRVTNSWTGEDGFLDLSITAEEGIEREVE